MLKENRTTQLSGTSSVEVDGIERQIAYMNGNVDEDGRISYNVSIQDRELFSANEKAVIADINQFEKNIFALGK